MTSHIVPGGLIRAANAEGSPARDSIPEACGEASQGTKEPSTEEEAPSCTARHLCLHRMPGM